MKLTTLIAFVCTIIIMHSNNLCCMESGLNVVDSTLMLASQKYGFSDHVVALSKTTDAAAQDPVGKTRLHYAVMLQEAQCVELLLKEQTEKPLATIQDRDGDTPLHTFFIPPYLGDGFKYDTEKALEMLTLVLKSHVDYTLINKRGETALHCAVKQFSFIPEFNVARAQFLKALVEHNACLDVTNHEGETPLHCVFINSGGSNTEMCQVLLDLGANPDPRNNLGETPLHYAVMHKEYNDSNYPSRIYAINALCAHKADPNCVTNSHETPLHYALKTHDYNADKSSSESRLVIVPTLLALGADPNAQNRLGVSALCALMHSTYTEQKKAIARDMLQNRSANPNLKTKAGFTCLHMAVSTQQLDWVRLLLEHKGTDITLPHEPTLTRATSIIGGKTALALAQEIQAYQLNQQQTDPEQPVKIARSRAVVGVNKLKDNAPNTIDEIVKLLEKHTEESKKK